VALKNRPPFKDRGARRACRQVVRSNIKQNEQVIASD
jgi:hypothetical protein